ncbi:MAG: oligosaccharide flippase family protein [Clostridiales bacterium]|nr:oligosaccharide flippase family protein [Clostridiales bacterium]
MNDKRETKLAKNTSILTLGTLCTKGIMFIMTPLFTRWVSQGNYGTFDLLVTYLNLIRPLITLDLKDATFRYLAEDTQGINDKEVVSTSIMVHAICMLGCIIISAILSCVFPGKSLLIRCYCILIIAETFFTLFTNITRGLKKIPNFAIANILFTVTMAISTTIFILNFNAGIYGLLLGYANGYIVSVIYMLFANRIYKFFTLKAIKLPVVYTMYRYAIPMLPNAIGWWIINVSDRTLVSIFLGTEANAILSVTSKLPNLCQQIFGQFSYSWQESSIESNSYDDREDFYNKILNTILRIMTSIVVLIMSANFLYFEILYSEEYYFGYYLSPILMIAILILVIAQFFDGIYIAQMKPKKSGSTMAIAALVNLIVDLVFINVIGLWAAVISTLISHIVLVSIRYYDIKKELRIRFSKECYAYLILVAYFTIGVYINIPWLNWLNLFAGILLFFTLNFSYIKPVCAKFKNVVSRNNDSVLNHRENE